MGLSWYRVHTIILNDLGWLIFVHIMPTTLVVGWAGSMALYELAVFDPSDPFLVCAFWQLFSIGYIGIWKYSVVNVWENFF
jgi:hypothetical protein